MSERRTIALVDDDVELMSMTKGLLEARGYIVWRAVDMIQFFTLLADENIPDLIITDMQMPGGGHRLVQRARSDRRLRSTPIIVMTGMPIVHVAKWFQAYQGVRFLEKGGEPKQLLELIAKSLEEAAPASPPAAVPLWAWQGSEQRGMTQGRTIALVDDDVELMSMTKDLLEARGYVVWRAVDMIQFFTLLADENIPDLIITDMQMPGGGHRLVQRARSDRRLRSTPIIVMTGMPIVHAAKWFQAYQGVRFLEKGGDPKQLLELIAKSLEEAAPAPPPAAQAPTPTGPVPEACPSKAPVPLWAWPSLQRRTGAKGRTIAVVNADMDRLFMLKDLLETKGYSVWRAMDMIQFFTFLADENIPDLVITDMELSGGGHHLVKKARGDPRLQSTPVIVLTWMPIAQAAKWFESYEGVHCLEKGGDPKQLLRLVAKCLKESWEPPR